MAPHIPLTKEQKQSKTKKTPTPTAPMNRDHWPSWARGIAWVKRKEDAGVGDTVHRMLGEGGERFKELLKKNGIPCGCDARRDEWNIRYSYARFHMHLSARGLGDSICGYYAACGLAESTGERVAYHAHSTAWLARVHHPLVDVLPQNNVGVDANADYGGQIARAVTRKQHYCDRLAEAMKIPQFAPALPKMVDRAAVREAGRIIIAPFSCYDSRNWDKWPELARRLAAKDGGKVLVIGSADQKERMAGLFRGMDILAGTSAENVTEKILGADVVIGNDSGIAHLGGMLGVPTVSVHAGGLPHNFLFDLAPSVRSVTPAKAIGRTDHNPGLLREISVEAVMEAVTMTACNERPSASSPSSPA